MDSGGSDGGLLSRVHYTPREQEYLTVLWAGTNAPELSDPSDRTLAKRKWETAVARYRHILKLEVSDLDRRPS